MQTIFSSDSLLSNEQLIRVFPYRTAYTPNDPFAFIGHPPFQEFRPTNRKLPVRISVCFKWWRRDAEAMMRSWSQYYDDVKIGGPAYGDLGDEFVPGRFLKEGCTITSRGCVKHCGWCPEKDRPLRQLYPIHPGWIVQDSNLLACTELHVNAVFDMLREQPHSARFPGGLDKDFFRPWHRRLFDSIRIDELWFACDLTSGLPALERAAELLQGISPEKLRCYTMIGWDEDESLLTAEKRIERVYELGFLPFCQLYKPDEGEKIYPVEWKAVQRKWARPAAYRVSRVTGHESRATELFQ
jgi:hypothetical protein